MRGLLVKVYSGQEHFARVKEEEFEAHVEDLAIHKLRGSNVSVIVTQCAIIEIVM